MQLDDLTIVVPTRDEAQNIGPFLRSLPDLVSLVVVDASRDETPDLVMQQRPERTQVIRHPGSVTIARQIGAQAATTSWLLFTDADVSFAPTYFRNLQSYGDEDALYGPKRSLGSFTHYYRWFALGQGLSHRLGVPAATGSNLLVRREVFFAIGGFDCSLVCNEDSELGWRIQRRGYRIHFAPDLVVYERDHRRLQQGATAKTLHSLVRCALLYTNLMPSRWRTSDWGYWSRVRPADGVKETQ
jgi:glycosyltransferase involved in cell wall biosynthesis